MLQVSDSHLIMTEPVLNFPSIQETMDEIFFEEYRVKGYLRISGVYFLLCAINAVTQDALHGAVEL